MNAAPEYEFRYKYRYLVRDNVLIEQERVYVNQYIEDEHGRASSESYMAPHNWFFAFYGEDDVH